MTDLAAVEAELHQRAIEAAGGRSDFGDEGYREGLGRLLQSFRDDQGLEGEDLLAAAGAVVVVRLVGRLYAIDGMRRRPEFARTSLREPVFICGLPRTGTTALHQLLSVDERFQGLEYWQSLTPMVRPPRAEWANLPEHRTAAAHAAADRERLQAIHWVDVDEYDENLAILQQTFRTNLSIRGPLPSFERWYMAQDGRYAYGWLKEVLQLIGLSSPEKPWLLKNPFDVAWTGTILELFDDARVIVTHRDPVKTIPSTVSLIVQLRRGSAVHGADGREIDAAAMAQRELNLWRVAIERYQSARAAAPDRYVDIWQRDLLSDPISVAHQVYDRLEIDLTPALEEAMSDWAQQNSHGSRGEHRYTLEDFGLDRENLEAEFAPYREQYGFA